PATPGPEPAAAAQTPAPEQFRAVQQSDQPGRLRRSFRGSALPLTAASLDRYLADALLSTYTAGHLSLRVVGNLNVWILLGFSQFALTFLITWLYIRHANRSLDPISSRIRDELEGDL